MTTQDDAALHQAAGELFLRALKQPTASRADFIRSEASRDPTLMGEALSLLANHVPESELRLNLPPSYPGSPAALSPEAPRLDSSYQVLRLVGFGGMGEVWEAAQQVPFSRRVAIKVVRAGLATPQLMRRFEVEKQVLASLNHRGIARAYDAGVTLDGRPYFVMEFVDGVPITEFCTQHMLSLRARLALFVELTEAVHYAHQRGVLHRDLKPSNVLVSGTTSLPSLKIIDFGIAKALGSEFDFGNTVTIPGMVIGTLEYMSPEQAEGIADLLSVSSDIYSLGALLYELLVGVPPLQVPQSTPVNPATVSLLVHAFDPIRPSGRLSRMPRNDREACLRSFGGIREQDYTRALRSDLDWIVLKSLEKAPQHRYSSAQIFGAEIQDYLDGKPVQARPPTASYVVRKWIRRKPVLAASLGFSALSLIIGLSLAIWQWNEATSQRTRAEQQLARLQHLSETVTQELAPLADLPGTTKTRSVLGSLAAETLASMQARAEQDPDALFSLAKTYEVIGHLQGDVESASLGDTKAAYENAARAFELLTRLHTLYPSRLEFSLEYLSSSLFYASVLQSFGRMKDGMAVMSKSLGLADSLDARGQLPSEKTVLLSSIYSSLAWQSRGFGEMEKSWLYDEKAVNILESALRLGAPRDSVISSLAQSYCQLAQSYPDLAVTEAAAVKCLSLSLEIMKARPFSQEPYFILGLAYRNMGDLRRMQGRPRDAIPFYEECAALRQRLVDADSSDLRSRHLLAYANARIGVAYFEMGDPDSALHYLHMAEAAQQAICHVLHPPGWAPWELSFTQLALGRVLASIGQISKSREYYSQIELNQNNSPEEPEAIKSLAYVRRYEDWAHSEDQWGSRKLAIERHLEAASAVDVMIKRLSARPEPCELAYQDAVAELVHVAGFLARKGVGLQAAADSLLDKARCLARTRLPRGNPAREAVLGRNAQSIEAYETQEVWLARQEDKRFALLCRRNIPHDPIWGLVPIPGQRGSDVR